MDGIAIKCLKTSIKTNFIIVLLTYLFRRRNNTSVMFTPIDNTVIPATYNLIGITYAHFGLIVLAIYATTKDK